MSAKESARHHSFLRRLQAGGRTNAYGAIPYLMREFRLTREDAFRSVCAFLDAQLELATPEPPKPRAPVKKSTKSPPTRRKR